MSNFTLYKRINENQLGDVVITGCWQTIAFWLSKNTDTNIDEVAMNNHPLYAIEENERKYNNKRIITLRSL